MNVNKIYIFIKEEKTDPEKQIKGEQKVFEAYCPTRVGLFLVSHNSGKAESKDKTHMLLC